VKAGALTKLADQSKLPEYKQEKDGGHYESLSEEAKMQIMARLFN
jgi:hypothetical protein